MKYYIIVNKKHLKSFFQATLYKAAKDAKRIHFKDTQYNGSWKKASKEGWLCLRVNIEYEATNE